MINHSLKITKRGVNCVFTKNFRGFNPLNLQKSKRKEEANDKSC